MNPPTDTSLDNCGCCEPEPASLPLDNRPGLPALVYRAGTYAAIFRRMRDRIGSFIVPDGDFAGTRPLASLTTRDSDDPAVALLDASAIVADVLTFYQERIANEGFLRTAVERRSILELARAIGYELSPGVAASVYLAFTVEDARGAPGVAEIPAGLKVQSVPPQNQLPQTFETSSAITAYAAWNALHPRTTYPQQVTISWKQLYLQGTATNLKPGDRLLIDSGGSQKMLSVLDVDIQSEQSRTLVTLDGTTTPSYTPPTLAQGQVDITKQVSLKATTVQTYIQNLQWTDSELNAFLGFNQWDRAALLTYLTNDRQENPASGGKVYALRAVVGFFGNNAPLYKSLPLKPNSTTKIAYPGQNWDAGNGWPIWKNQQTNKYYKVADVFLERVVQGLVPASWVCIEKSGSKTLIHKISKVIERSHAAFALSGKLTGLILRTPGGALLEDNTTSKPDDYTIRETTAYLQSEKLTLIELPITADIPGKSMTLELDGLALGLSIGQAVALSGERADAPGVTESEILIVKDINHVGGFTVLTFETGLQYTYKRDTVTINANVAPATHGETVTEILGSGSGSQTNQQFTLRKPPLTYTASPTASGSASTMQLRVNNLLWSEAPSLYGLSPNDQSYTIRIADDASAAIIVGDGIQGARLPTGVNNVVATYRSGIGLAGQVAADSLTILQTRPLGLRSVTNPLAASGAGDPEEMDNARAHAPLTVRTLDRIVSRDDYQDFASAFAGIGKAQAIDLWNGDQHLVHITVAGADGKPITDAQFLKNFNRALDSARDPIQRVKVDTFDSLLFDLVANVAVDSRYVVNDVFTSVQAALADAFSFSQRGFGQPVTTAEVVTVIQDVAGVIYVDLDSFYLSGSSPAFNPILPANFAHLTGGIIQRAQLLLLNTLGVSLTEVKV